MCSGVWKRKVEMLSSQVELCLWKVELHACCLLCARGEFFTCGQKDDVGLAIASVHCVAALGHTLDGGAWLIGHSLAGEGHD